MRILLTSLALLVAAAGVRGDFPPLGPDGKMIESSFRLRLRDVSRGESLERFGASQLVFVRHSDEALFTPRIDPFPGLPLWRICLADDGDTLLALAAEPTHERRYRLRVVRSSLQRGGVRYIGHLPDGCVPHTLSVAPNPGRHVAVGYRLTDPDFGHYHRCRVFDTAKGCQELDLPCGANRYCFWNDGRHFAVLGREDDQGAWIDLTDVGRTRPIRPVTRGVFSFLPTPDGSLMWVKLYGGYPPYLAVEKVLGFRPDPVARPTPQPIPMDALVELPRR